MTIREYVEGRGTLIRNLNFCWIGVMVALIFIFSTLSDHPRFIWFVVVFAALIAISHTIAWKTKCPRCLASLYVVAIRASNPFYLSTSCDCPNCGVSLNESMEIPLNSRE
jgi:hypothetical protein